MILTIPRRNQYIPKMKKGQRSVFLLRHMLVKEMMRVFQSRIKKAKNACKKIRNKQLETSEES